MKKQRLFQSKQELNAFVESLNGKSITTQLGNDAYIVTFESKYTCCESCPETLCYGCMEEDIESYDLSKEAICDLCNKLNIAYHTEEANEKTIVWLHERVQIQSREIDKLRKKARQDKVTEGFNASEFVANHNATEAEMIKVLDANLIKAYKQLFCTLKERGRKEPFRLVEENGKHEIWYSHFHCDKVLTYSTYVYERNSSKKVMKPHYVLGSICVPGSRFDEKLDDWKDSIPFIKQALIDGDIEPTEVS